VDQCGPLIGVDRQAEWSVNKVNLTLDEIGLWIGVDHGLEWTVDRNEPL